MWEFLNPGFLAAGAGLISLPILIHLINRLRYRRIRWAAMEFLLKSQKRNRRRLMLEQFLLLALRCLLVLLATLLVARYLFAFLQPQNTTHVVLLDDTLSMTDHWRAEGEKQDSFKVGKELILNEIAKYAAQARTHQRLILLNLSDPATVRFDERLDDRSAADLQRLLSETECSCLRVDPLKGVEAARDLLEKHALNRRILHLVSDFRQGDWGEPEGTNLTKTLEGLGQAGVQINLIDAAHPPRSELQQTVQFHDNLGVVDLRPLTRVAARDVPVECIVTVANYGVSERKNVRVTIKVNGGERAEASLSLLSVPPGQTSQTFMVAFDREGFNQLTATLENEEVGLQGDNIRYAVVEVRKQVPILIVDGSGTGGQRPGGDTYHLHALFTSTRSYQVVSRGTSELDRADLEQYPSVYLLNVRELSDRAIRNLEAYVRDGGSVAFFLGDRVFPDHYNKKLYADGKGLFPVPLADRPFPQLSDPELQPDLFDRQPKIFLRNATHPVLVKVWPLRDTFFQFLPIKRYYPVPRKAWKFEPGEVEELITLPNQKAVADYVDQAGEILDQLSKLAASDDYKVYQPGLEEHRRAIRDSLTGKPLYELANALENLVQDRGEPGNPKRPNLVEMWSRPELLPLRNRIGKFREEVQLGDPLVVSKQFGKGKVVAFLTTAGRAWNDWAGGSLASATYPIVMSELQRWLLSGTSEVDRTVGTPLELSLDSSRFDSKMHRFYLPEVSDHAAERAGGPIDLKEQVGNVVAGRVTFFFEEARKPGVYRFDLERRIEEGNPASPTRTESRAVAFNVDTNESDLRRATRDDLERAVPGARLRVPGSGWAQELADRRTDLSESGWFYVLCLLVLLAEQALAVHLSFHLKSAEASAAPVRTAA